jgi:hypothetical protein
MRPDPVLKFEIGAWLQTFTGTICGLKVTREMSAWSEELKLPAIESNRKAVSAATEWFSNLGLPSSLAKELARDAEVFVLEMQANEVDCNEPPWIFWSRFPPWLKRKYAGKKLTEIRELDLRLTFQRVALSPQDELNELASLSPSMLMVNPTFEFTEGTQSNEPILAFSRQWDQVSRRSLTSLEASVLDHVRESFRTDRATTLVNVSQETGVRKEFVNAAIESLIADFFLLGHSLDSSSERSQ